MDMNIEPFTWYRIPMKAAPAPRQSQRDRWRPSPSTLRYRAAKDELRRLLPLERLPGAIELIFVLPLPKQVKGGKKARAALIGQPHESKPDTDNLTKFFKDTYGSDSHVYYEAARKIWGEEPAIFFRAIPPPITPPAIRDFLVCHC